MILGKNNLLEGFCANLKNADGLDIAVAWATMCPALDAIINFARTAKQKPRVIVGISGDATTPSALKELAKCCHLRITTGETGTFHPKVYRFPNSAVTVCWIGSANLTKRGFGLNDEAVHEFEDDGKTGVWFEELWSSLKPATEADITEYAKTWKPKVDPAYAPSVPAPKSHPFHLMEKVHDWASYVAALKSCDAYWIEKGWGFSVLGESHSYYQTIYEGNKVVRSRDWSAFTKDDVKILLGYSKGEDASYGLLGSMKGAAKATNTFLEPSKQNLVNRIIVQDAILPLERAKDVPSKAAIAVSTIRDIKRFNSGVATRLITLIRPDSAVSVNAESRFGLARLSGLPVTTLGSPVNYERLLKWIQQQPWFDVVEPQDMTERVIWSMRAALLDAFVYGYNGQ
jgi:HKD family nuclease